MKLTGATGLYEEMRCRLEHHVDLRLAASFRMYVCRGVQLVPLGAQAGSFSEPHPFL